MAEERSVLVIGAHSDECEFCAGGLTLRLIEKGYRVVFLNTVGNLSYWSTVGPRKNKESVEDAKKAAAVLGAEKVLLPYKNHEFITGDITAMKEIVKTIQEVNPEIAMIHWANDRWYDHRATAVNSFEALVQSNTFFEHDFKSNLKEIYAFEAGPVQTFDFYADFYVDISDKMPKIVESLSQFKALGKDIIEALERQKKVMAGLRACESNWSDVGVEYAEAYKFLRYRPGEISILPKILGDNFRITRWPEETHSYFR